jgi:hypothetical protein
MAMASEGTNRRAVAALHVIGATRRHAAATENIILSIHHSASGVGRIKDGGQRDLFGITRRLHPSVECVKCRRGAFGSITYPSSWHEAAFHVWNDLEADVDSSLQLR